MEEEGGTRGRRIEDKGREVQGGTEEGGGTEGHTSMLLHWLEGRVGSEGMEGGREGGGREGWAYQRIFQFMIVIHCSKIQY
jgi:hypothetical protein